MSAEGRRGRGQDGQRDGQTQGRRGTLGTPTWSAPDPELQRCCCASRAPRRPPRAASTATAAIAACPWSAGRAGRARPAAPARPRPRPPPAPRALRGRGGACGVTSWGRGLPLRRALWSRVVTARSRVGGDGGGGARRGRGRGRVPDLLQRGTARPQHRAEPGCRGVGGRRRAGRAEPLSGWVGARSGPPSALVVPGAGGRGRPSFCCAEPGGSRALPSCSAWLWASCHRGPSPAAGPRGAA